MGWYEDDEDGFRLTTRDMADALEGADREAFLALMVKAVDAFNQSQGGVVLELQVENRKLKHSVKSLRGDLDHVREQWRNARHKIEQLEGFLAERQKKLEATDHQRAGELVRENEFLKQRVEIQRRIIAGHERTIREKGQIVLSSPIGSGLGQFASPLTASASPKAH